MLLASIALIIGFSVVSTGRAEPGPEWALVDSISFQTLIPAGERVVVSFDTNANSLGVTMPPDNLTDLAKQAIEKAPIWLKRDLQDTFARIKELYPAIRKFKPERQAELTDNIMSTFASLILEVQDPLVDEVAFQVAHLAPEVLAEMLDHPIVLVDNAEYVYRNDEYLNYVEVMDYGTSSDEDYHSTVEYRVRTAEGDTIKCELPREYYYWYIVHPKLTKELPAYIDPHTGSPADPPGGVFWRDYFFNHADPEYPLLKDQLAGCSTLWNGFRNSLDNGAVGVVTKWIKDVMVFKTPPTRSTVPVKIYAMHMGTCSEHSYITAAAARTALIPAVVTVAYRNDHKWNEFYERRWIHWEPVNTMIDSPDSYDPGWWDLAAAFDWRGDGYVWTVSERYTPECTLTVRVEDANGNPVDGARVVIDSEGHPGPRCSFGYTNTSGECQFTLGDKRNFYGRVDSDIGCYPSSGEVEIIFNSLAGEHYLWSCNLTGEIPQLLVKENPLPQTRLDRYKLEFDFNAKEVVHGLNPDSWDMFSETISPGNIDFFICDSENLTQYTSGNHFGAFQIAEDIDSKDGSFVVSTDDRWYLVLSNEDAVTAKEVVDVTVTLYERSPYQATETSTPCSGTSEFALFQNYPNPCNQGTIISYDLKTPTRAVLRIYDISGKLVRTLVDADQNQGFYTISWDAKDSSGREVASGLYFYSLEAGDFICAKKMLILK